MGERGERHVGILLCLSSDPFQSQRDRYRARSPWPISCLGSEMTPGFAFAAPGPTDGLGSLASRPHRLPRARLSRLAMPGGVPVRASHTRGSGLLGWLSLAGPRLSNNFRGSIQTLLTCSTRLLTFVSSRQRVSLPGRWLACALGRIFTSWITSTDFIGEAILVSQQLRVYLVTTRLC